MTKIQEVANKVAYGRFKTPLVTPEAILDLINVLADRVNYLEKQIDELRDK